MMFGNLRYEFLAKFEKKFLTILLESNKVAAGSLHWKAFTFSYKIVRKILKINLEKSTFIIFSFIMWK